VKKHVGRLIHVVKPYCKEERALEKEFKPKTAMVNDDEGMGKAKKSKSRG